MLDLTPSEALTSHPLSTTEASHDDPGEDTIDVTPREEWIRKVEMERQYMEILGHGKFKTLKEFFREKTENIRRKLEVR